MSRTEKCFAVISVICVLCTVVLCTVTKREESVEESSGESIALLIDDINLNSVAGIVLKNQSGAVPLMIYDGEISCINEPEDTGTDSSAMKSFAYRMAHMPAIENLGLSGDISDYGLDEPSASVSLILTDGETVRISLGNEAPFGGGFYVMKENDPDLYLTDEVTARMLSYSIDDFRKLEVLPDFSHGVSLKDLTHFSLIHGEDIIEIAGITSGDGILYTLMQPFEAPLDWENVNACIFSPLAHLDECRFVSADADPSEYGFDDADDVYYLFITVSNKTYLLGFRDAGNDMFYVCRDGCSQIVSVSSELLPFLYLKLSDLVSDTLYSVSAASLSTVRIETEQMDCTVKVTGSGEKIGAQIGDRILTAGETVSFIKAVTMIPQAGVLTDEAEISGEWILRLTFSLRSGEENIIELIPVTEWHCAVIADGNYGPVTYTSTVREIISEVSACMAGR